MESATILYQRPPTFKTIREWLEFTDDNDYISFIGLLIDVGRGPIAIAFESFERIFGLIDADNYEEAMGLVYPVLYGDGIYHRLHELDAGGVYEVIKAEGGNWTIVPNDKIPIPEYEKEVVDFQDSIPANEILPLYPSCKVVRRSNFSVVREFEDGLAEVTLAGDDLAYFFKAVKRKPKENLIREVSNLSALNHPHIVRLSAIVVNDSGDVTGLLFPFARRGSLWESASKDAPNATKLGWVRDIVDALQYIATRGVVYEDVKAANIVIFEDEVARLTDFDGGATAGHWRSGRGCFGLAVLLQDLKCEGLGVVELVKQARSVDMGLEEFKQKLDAIIVT